MQKIKNNIDSSFLQKIEEEAKNDDVQKIVVGALIFSEDGKVLLLQRISDDFMGGLVELPSGNVDKEESIIDGLIREVLEETGLKISSIDKYAGSFYYKSSSGKKVRQFNFVTSVHDGDIKLNPDEHSKYYYVTPGNDDFNSLNISKKTKNTILSI